jgi:molybdopterin-guanine dinucleotide biosynthesis protein A
MGQDKAALFAERLAALLSAVAAPVLEIGPGRTTLPALADPGQGPLCALAAAPAVGDALVLACDLPFVTAELLRFLADQPGTAVPVVGGRMQPLCARYAAADLARAAAVVAGGGQSMRDLLHGADVAWLDEAAWGGVAEARHFADVDTPEDLARAGLDPTR